jgi:hypothetical protein
MALNNFATILNIGKTNILNGYSVHCRQTVEIRNGNHANILAQLDQGSLTQLDRIMPIDPEQLDVWVQAVNTSFIITMAILIFCKYPEDKLSFSLSPNTGQQ